MRDTGQGDLKKREEKTKDRENQKIREFRELRDEPVDRDGSNVCV